MNNNWHVLNLNFLQTSWVEQRSRFHKETIYLPLSLVQNLVLRVSTAKKSGLCTLKYTADIEKYKHELFLK